MLTVIKDQCKAKKAVSRKDKKFHYIFSVNDKNHTICFKATKQDAVRSLVRLQIIKCECSNKPQNKCNYYSSRTVYLNSNDTLYGCGCDLKKFDVLEEMLSD